MKKHISVFMMMARLTFLPALLVSLAGGAAVYATVSLYNSAMGLQDVQSFNKLNGDFFYPVRWPLYIGLALLCVLLMLNLRERGGVQPSYTLRRLSVSEVGSFAWQGAACALAVFVYFAFTGAGVLAYTLRLQAAGMDEAGALSALVMLYGSSTAHALLPLADAIVYVRMALYCAALGFGCAYSSLLARRGHKIAFAPLVILLVCILTFPAYVGNYYGESIKSGVAALFVAWFVFQARMFCAPDADDDGGETGETTL